MMNDKRLNIITKYYYITAAILKDFIKNVPTLKLTQAKKYLGQYIPSRNLIRISTYGHVDCKSFADKEDLVEILETICHEFAHINICNHGKQHENLTKSYLNYTVKMFETCNLF